MYVNSGATVTIGENVKLVGGYARRGGSIYVNENGTLNLQGEIVKGFAVSEGGGIYNNVDATLIMEDGLVEGNDADEGGGIYNSHGTVNLTGGTIKDNTAKSNGGGINNTVGTVNLTGGFIKDNTANSDGGGIYNSRAKVTGNFNGPNFGLPTKPRHGGYSLDGGVWKNDVTTGDWTNTNFDIYFTV